MTILLTPVRRRARMVWAASGLVWSSKTIAAVTSPSMAT
jgi:hypothetical protein